MAVEHLVLDLIVVIRLSLVCQLSVRFRLSLWGLLTRYGRRGTAKGL